MSSQAARHLAAFLEVCSVMEKRGGGFLPYCTASVSVDYSKGDDTYEYWPHSW